MFSMFPHHQTCTPVFVFCALLILVQAGCDLVNAPLKEAVVSNIPETPPSTPAPPANPNGKTLIEWVKCEAIAQTISSYKLSATYRFASGKPKPNLQYLLDVSFPGCPFRELKRIPGNELQMEGTIEWVYELPGIGARGDSEVSDVRFQFSEEFERQGNQAQFLGVSQPHTVQLDISRIGL